MLLCNEPGSRTPRILVEIYMGVLLYFLVLHSDSVVRETVSLGTTEIPSWEFSKDSLHFDENFVGSIRHLDVVRGSTRAVEVHR